MRYRQHEGRDSHSARFNYLSLWLGHSSIQATLIYLELVPNRAGTRVVDDRRGAF